MPDPRSPEEAEDVADFQSVRPRLFGIAYRMLGRVSDAEDVVQDVWLRWQSADRALVRDRVAFLVTITTRVTLNVLGSARVRREVPVGRWLPGQVVSSEDPTVAAERSVDLERAVLLLFQRLSPIERAVFVLREAFGYPFRDIAEALRISEANARQLRRRSCEHLALPRHEPVHRTACERLLGAFLDAARIGALAHLERLLIDDVLSHAGGERRQRPEHRRPRGGVMADDRTDPVGFETHIKPLFREIDRQSMLGSFDLWSYDDVNRHADAILNRLVEGTMPCDGSWPPARIGLFRRWTESGKPR